MNSTTSRWYQEPMAIMVFAIPLLTVVAGLITVWIAVQSADHRVVEGVNRFGMQTTVEQQQ